MGLGLSPGATLPYPVVSCVSVALRGSFPFWIVASESHPWSLTAGVPSTPTPSTRGRVRGDSLDLGAPTTQVNPLCSANRGVVFSRLGGGPGDMEVRPSPQGAHPVLPLSPPRAEDPSPRPFTAPQIHLPHPFRPEI